MSYDPHGPGFLPDGYHDEPPRPRERHLPRQPGSMGEVHKLGRVCQTRLAAAGSTIASGVVSEVTCQECRREMEPARPRRRAQVF